MVVTLCLPGVLREFAGGARTVPVDVAEPATVGGVLDRLASEFPALERRVRDEQGALRRHVNLFVGSVNVRDAAGLATEIAPGGELVVIPSVSGG
jgi:sulfur-carrier protein